MEISIGILAFLIIVLCCVIISLSRKLIVVLEIIDEMDEYYSEKIDELQKINVGIIEYLETFEKDVEESDFSQN